MSTFAKRLTYSLRGITDPFIIKYIIELTVFPLPPPVAVSAILRFIAGLVANFVRLLAVCWLAVGLALGVAAALIQPIRDVFEGALDGGHQRLNGFQLVRGGVDGGVFSHDVAVVVTEGTEGPLKRSDE